MTERTPLVLDEQHSCRPTAAAEAALADLLGEADALADYRARLAAGTLRTVPHHEARARLHLPPNTSTPSRRGA